MSDELESTTEQSDVDSTGATTEELGTAATEQSEDSFSTVDPSSLSEDLQGVYKSLQSDYTKKTKTLSDQRRELEEFSGLRDRFNADPQGTIRQLAGTGELIAREDGSESSEAFTAAEPTPANCIAAKPRHAPMVVPAPAPTRPSATGSEVRAR